MMHTPLAMHFSAAPEAAESALWFDFLGEDLILDADGHCPANALLSALPPAPSLFGIGEHEGRPCLTRQWPAGTQLPEGLSASSLRTAYDTLSETEYRFAARAKLLHTWNLQHRFCGACGTPTEIQAHEPARRCPACGLLSFPRLSPAIMVLIHRGDDILLARSPHFKTGIFSALAGFVDAGESAEECVHREVMEEVGLRVTNLRWFSSQAWPFPHSLMLAFHADYAGGDIVPQPGEIEEAIWVSKQALREGRTEILLPRPISIAYRLIRSALD